MLRIIFVFHFITAFTGSVLLNLFSNNAAGPLALVNALFGAIKQSADNITFAKWKDKNVMKRKRGKREGSATPGQAANERKFALLVSLSRILSPAFKIGLKAYVASQTAYNAFIKFNYPATSDNGSEASITNADIVISKGSVGSMQNFAAATGASAGEIDLSWDDNSNGTTSLGSDTLFVAVMNADNEAVHSDLTAVSRGDVSHTIELPDVYDGVVVSVFAFFIRADRSATSDNAYDTATVGS